MESKSGMTAGPNGQRRWPGAAALILLACAAGCVAGRTFDATGLDTGRFGTVHVHPPSGDKRALILLFSDPDGWTVQDDTAADRLAMRGAVVVGVDLRSYRAALDASDGECLYLLSEIESLSQQVQRRLGLSRYLSPIVAGIGEAATLVEAMLAQSPAATVAGAVAVDPVETLRTRLPLCAGAPFRRSEAGFVYGPAPQANGFLRVAFSSQAQPAGRVHAIATLEPHAIVRDGSGEREGGEPRTLLVDLLADAIEAAPKGDEALPGWLIEMRAATPSRTVAIVLSGDGGWRDLDRTIATGLRDRGLDVVGWDSLRYFWDRKTPQRVAEDLEARIDRCVRDWNNDDVLLVGYSFGADVLPFAYNRLPDDAKARVRQVSLLAPSTSADFEFHVAGWLGSESADAEPTAPELARMPPSKVQCFSGREDEDSVCPALSASGVETVATSGGHHFDGDYAALTARILDGLARRLQDNTR